MNVKHLLYIIHCISNDTVYMHDNLLYSVVWNHLYNLYVGNKLHGIFDLCDRQYDRQ